MQLLDHKNMNANPAAIEGEPRAKQNSNDARSQRDLQIGGYLAA
jgi:hypothetical protein